MKTEEKEKKPSKLEKMVMKITAPMKMDCDIEFAQLCVFVGQNDSGKTFLLKIAYALSAVGCSKFGPPIKPLEAAQFVLDNTFTDQNLDGSIKAIYTQGSVSVDLDKGKITNVEIDLDKPVPMTFMSTDMRTFDQMNLYLRMRDESGTDPLIRMNKMLKAYRLYDITYMEPMIARCPIKIPDLIMESLKSTYDFKEDITSIDVDNGSFIGVLKDGTKKNLATYGKGHQAVLNMMIGAST